MVNRTGWKLWRARMPGACSTDLRKPKRVAVSKDEAIREGLHYLIGFMMAAVLSIAPADESPVFTAVICPAGVERPRNTEGDIVELKNGSLLLAYSEFVGSDSSDFAQGRIAGKISHDGGR